MYTCAMIIKSLNLFMFILDKLNGILWNWTNGLMLYLKLMFVEDGNCIGIREKCVLISINVCSIESIQWSVSRLSNALFNIRSKHTYINCPKSQTTKNIYCTNSDWHFLFGWVLFFHPSFKWHFNFNKKKIKKTLNSMFSFSLSIDTHTRKKSIHDTSSMKIQTMFHGNFHNNNTHHQRIKKEDYFGIKCFYVRAKRE